MRLKPSNGGAPLDLSLRRNFLIWSALGGAALALAACGGEADPTLPANAENEQFAEAMTRRLGIATELSNEEIANAIYLRTFTNPITAELGSRVDIGTIITDRTNKRIKVQLYENGSPFFPEFSRPIDKKVFPAPEQATIAVFPQDLENRNLSDSNNLPTDLRTMAIFYGNPGTISRIKEGKDMVEKHMEQMAKWSKAGLEVLHYNLMPSSRFNTLIDVGSIEPVNPPVEVAATRPLFDGPIVRRHDTVFFADMIEREARMIGFSTKAMLVGSEANELTNRIASQHPDVVKNNQTLVVGEEGPSTLVGLAATISENWRNRLLGSDYLKLADLISDQIDILAKNS